MNDTANTIWTKAYTPGGLQVGITFSLFDDNGNMRTATDIDALVSGAGFLNTLPGAKPGESVETITHVMRRTRHADDGRTIPIIAFYIDNPKFENKYDHIYMDTPEQVADFESWSGLKIVDIPEYEGTTWVERNGKPTANKYIRALPEPKQIAAAMGTWRNPKTGETGETMKIQRYLGIPETPPKTGDADKPESTGGKRTSWLTDNAKLEKVKSDLSLLELEYGEVSVATVRKSILAGGYPTPDAYLTALEDALKALPESA